MTYKNKEDTVEYQKKYRETHKEQINEYNRKRYENNKEKYKEHQRIYRELHKEEINEKQRNYSKDNREHINSRQREWNKTNPEKVKGYKEKRKSIDMLWRRNNRRNLRTQVYKMIAEKRRGIICCWRCGETREWVLTLGHKNCDGKTDREKFKGGLFKAIINKKRPIEDLEIECMNCNSSKAWWGKYPDELTKELFEELMLQPRHLK